MIDDSEWEDLIEEVGGDAFAARQLAVRRRSSARSGNNFVNLIVLVDFLYFVFFIVFRF